MKTIIDSLIPFSLLFWIISGAFALPSSSSSSPLPSPSPSSTLNYEEVTTTVIDILSENVEFSSFLRILQRHQLIPFLNELDNITLVAPVNSAFVARCHGSNFKNCDANIVEDFSLNDLKRYIIKKPILSNDFDGVQIFETFYRDGSPVLVDSDPEENLLRINGLNVVDVDLAADSQDSIVQGIERLFEDSKSTLEVLDQIPSVSTLKSILKDHKVQNQTLLAPKDSAFTFKDYELNYLLSDYGIDDSSYLINALLVGGIYGGDINETTVDKNGYKLSLSSDDKGAHITVNHTLGSTESNILAENAMVHLFDDHALIPKIEFNPLKVMVGLNSSVLVDELILQKLSDLITNNSIKQTVFIPTDPNQFAIASKNSNLYHFVNEKIEDLSISRTLYDSKFCNSKKLGQQCQRMKIEQDLDKNQVLINDNVIVQDGPFKVGETLIYLTDEDLRTPNEISSSIRSVLHCSSSLKIMQRLGLLKLSNNGLGYTFFLPCYDAWDDFELTMNYFETNRTALNELMKNFVLNGLIYTDYSGEKIELENMNGNLITISNAGTTTDEKLDLKYDDIDVRLFKNDDILFNQGVVHPIEKVFFPSNIDISLRKIISASDSDLFLKFASFFPDIDNALNQDNYSILLPSQASLEKSGPFDSNSTLEKFLKLHLIHPSSSRNLYDCIGDIQTLATNINLTCSKVAGRRDSFLQISGGSDNGVRVLSRGCANVENHNCVFAIDRPVSLDWLNEHQHYHLSLPGVALAIGVMLGVVVMIFVFVCLMLFVARKKKSFISGVEQGENPTENSPLIGNQTDNSSAMPVNEQRNGRINFESHYSSNTVVDPISVSRRSNKNNVQIG